MSEKPLPVVPVLDHNGKPYSPAQLLALQRGELTRLRVMRDAMILADAWSGKPIEQHQDTPRSDQE